MNKITTPWPPGIVAHLTREQQRDDRHPYTCPNGSDANHRGVRRDLGVLVPTVRGWICQYCDYTQE